MIKNHIIYNPVADYVFDTSRLDGPYIWDKAGKKYIDFTCGWNVANLGWNHPEITQAVIEQAKKGFYIPMEMAEEIQIKYSDLLTNSLPKELNAIGRATGGTEANEEALKTARAYTKRKKIIGFRETYHGQSFGTLSIGLSKESVGNISPLVGDFIQIDYPDIYRTEKTEQELLFHFASKLEKILSSKDVAAIITEAGIVTGWGSVKKAPKGYLEAIKKLAEKYGTLIILDEVGTGFSRCGKLFGMFLENGFTPDIVTFAKGISNGAGVVGAMVTREKIARDSLNQSRIISTFGWQLTAVAAAHKTLEIHLRDKVWEKSEQDGGYLLSTLRRELADIEVVGNIRGIGMEIGVDLVTDRKSKGKNTNLWREVVTAAKNAGLYLSGDGESVIQLMPPLTIERNVLDEGIEILIKAIKESIK